MKKLLVFTENYVRGGGNRYLVDLVNAIGSDYDAIVIAGNHGAIFPEDVARLCHPVSLQALPFWTKERMRNSLIRLPRFFRRVIILPFMLLLPVFFIYNLLLDLFFLLRTKPSVVLCCNGGYPASRGALVMVLAAKLIQIPVLMSIVSMPEPRKKLLLYFEKCMDYLVWNAADAIIANARAIAVALEEYRDVLPEKVHVVYNGLRSSGVPDKSNADEQIRIGCVARMDQSKGVMYLLEAFVQLADKYPNLQLVLIGDGDAFGEMQSRIEACGLSDRVDMPGYYSGNPNELLGMFDIYVFPSLWEGFPYSVIEAMRAGCTIVATRVGGIPEAIRDGADGLLIDPGSVAAISGALETLLLDPALRAELAASARKRFEEKFSLDAMAVSATQVLADVKSMTNH